MTDPKNDEDKTVVLKRAESMPNNVTPSIRIPDMDVKEGNKYQFELYKLNRKEKTHISSLNLTVHNTRKSITIPKKVVMGNGLKPGMRVKLVKTGRVHNDNVENINDYTDNSRTQSDNEFTYIDYANVGKDVTSSDNLSSVLHSTTVWEKLSDIQERVKYVNAANGKVATDTISRNKVGYKIPFRMDVRSELDASYQDTIKIYLHKNEGEGGENDGEGPHPKNSDELIDIMNSMNEMVTELYAAYKNSKND